MAGSWAVPERSGVVPGSSRARIIDFSMVLEGFGGGCQGGAISGRGLSDPLNQDFSRQTKHHWNWASAWAWARARAWARTSTGTRARARTQGKWARTPTHAVAQSAVADISRLFQAKTCQGTTQNMPRSSPNDPQSIPKSTKNLSKIHQKSIKNP